MFINYCSLFRVINCFNTNFKNYLMFYHRSQEIKFKIANAFHLNKPKVKVTFPISSTFSVSTDLFTTESMFKLIFFNGSATIFITNELTFSPSIIVSLSFC